MFLFPPALILIIGGLLIPFVNKNLRSTLVVILPLITLYGVWQPDEPSTTFHVFGLDLLPYVLHDFTRIFATVFCLAAVSGGIFALPQLEKDGPLEVSAAYVYAGGAIGVTFCGDFVSLFLFWELMAVASTVVVLCGRTSAATRAAIRYAYMHFFGGVLLLIGILGLRVHTGSFNIMPLDFDIVDLLALSSAPAEIVCVFLMLVGVLINAAAPPFSAWLADAYPESSPSGAVFLSAFTTKTAVFVLLTVFAGSDVLIYIGLFMVFYGIIYAMLENNMRRILSYSIVSQIGFMVVGVGIGSELAQLGVAVHAFCHIIYKALLLMSAGSVIFMTGNHRFTEVGGLWHSMKYTAICGIIGALAISAFPWTSGFVSKSMISTASADAHLPWVWFSLAAASAASFLYIGIKFPWFTFFHKDSGLRPDDPPPVMCLTMLLLSGMCILPGLFPQYLYMLLPVEKVPYEPYTYVHVVTQLQLLLWAGLAFFLALPWLKRTNTISLDMDWIYRVALRNVLLMVERGIVNSVAGTKAWSMKVLELGHARLVQVSGPFGVLARTWSLHTTVTLVGTLLVLLLVVYYVR